jgi:hypothetical protein
MQTTSELAKNFADAITSHMAVLVEHIKKLEEENKKFKTELETLKNTTTAKKSKHNCRITSTDAYKIVRYCPEEYKESHDEKEYREYYMMRLFSVYGCNTFTAKQAVDHIKSLNSEDQKNSSMSPFVSENEDLKKFRFDKATNANYKTWDRNISIAVTDYIEYLVNDGFLSVNA